MLAKKKRLFAVKRSIGIHKSMRIMGAVVLAMVFVAGAFLISRRAEALSYQDSANVGFEIQDSINVSISGDITIPEIFPGNSTDSSAVNVVVSTNTTNGYTLSARMATASSDLTSSGTSEKFSSVSAEGSGVASLSVDTWGYKTSTNSGSTWSNYLGLPISSADAKTLIDTDTAPSGGSATMQFKIGANAGSSKVAGAYSNSITFYAVAKGPASLCGSTKEMQTIDSSYISSMTTNTQVQMCDARDGKTYWVAKLADNKVWMTQNLDLVLSTSTALTPSDSNVSSNWTPENNTQTYQYKEAGGTTHSDAIWNSDYNTKAHSYRPASDPSAGTSGDYGNDGDTYFSPAYITNGTTMSSYKTEAECIAGGNTQSDCQHWSVGTLYSWYAATAGTGNASVSTSGQNVTDSICPKGWHLPSSTSSGEFQALVTAGSITGSTITSAPYYFLRAGYYLGDYGAVYATGIYGLYWSRTSRSNTSNAYLLGFDSSDVGPSGSDARYSGMGVRCIAGS